jgi:hypothetical protein
MPPVAHRNRIVKDPQAQRIIKDYTLKKPLIAISRKIKRFVTSDFVGYSGTLRAASVLTGNRP